MHSIFDGDVIFCFKYIPGSKVHKHYKWKAAAVCGGLQIFLGCCSVAVNAAVIPFDSLGSYGIGFGIWSPVLVRHQALQKQSYWYLNPPFESNQRWKHGNFWRHASCPTISRRAYCFLFCLIQWFVAGAFGIASACSRTTCTVSSGFVFHRIYRPASIFHGSIEVTPRLQRYHTVESGTRNLMPYSRCRPCLHFNCNLASPQCVFGYVTVTLVMHCKTSRYVSDSITVIPLDAFKSGCIK